jgi:hypothetical protein
VSIVGSVRKWLRTLLQDGPKAPGPEPTSPCFLTRLGIWQTADADSVRKAYMRVSAAVQGDADRQRLLEEAYRVLANPAQREVYLLVRRGLARAGLFPLQEAPVAGRATPGVFGRLWARFHW